MYVYINTLYESISFECFGRKKGRKHSPWHHTHILTHLSVCLYIIISLSMYLSTYLSSPCILLPSFSFFSPFPVPSCFHLCSWKSYSPNSLVKHLLNYHVTTTASVNSSDLWQIHISVLISASLKLSNNWHLVTVSSLLIYYFFLGHYLSVSLDKHWVINPFLTILNPYIHLTSKLFSPVNLWCTRKSVRM